MRPGEPGPPAEQQLPDEAWLAALAGLTDMGPRRLDALLAAGPPAEAWSLVATGRVPGEVPAPSSIRATWRIEAGQLDVGHQWARYLATGITVVSPSNPGYPAALVADPDRPAVLFLRGDPAALAGPCVAVVGTRRCTRYGRDVARAVGARLCELGVAVVSGLAVGIDAEAHHGALAVGAAPPVGVVGSGLDTVYPGRNRALWHAVADAGVLVSEAPLGVRPTRWRFPARNRIIAALASAVVVVESHAHGGSLITATEALDRDRLVVAVPGPVTSPASAGTNRLLSDGAQVLCDVDDLGSMLALIGLPIRAPSGSARRSGGPAPAAPSGLAREVLEAVAWQPVSFDELAARVDLGLSDLAVVVEGLIAAGSLAQRGAWLERAVPPASGALG